jgi:hypothetical protein
MLAVMRGQMLDDWFIFRGEDTKHFLHPLEIFAFWPCNVAIKGHVREKGLLIQTKEGSFVLVVKNESLPDVCAQSLWKMAVDAAEKQLEAKHATA